MALACLLVVVLGFGVLSEPGGASFPGSRGPVAFVQWGQGGEGHIWVANRAGGAARRISGAESEEEWSPVFFPDGRRVAYVSKLGSRFNIYVRAVNVGDPSYPGEPVFATRGATWINSLAVAKAGNRIVYVPDLGDEELFSIRIDGTNRRRLTNNRVRDLQPDVSPRNGHIVFVRRVARGNQEIFTMRPDGRGIMRLTHTGAVEVAPSFSPNGRKIAYAVRTGKALRGGAQGAGADWTIFTINADGGHRRRITPKAVSGANPVFSPDGRSILFQRWRAGRSRLAVMRANGTQIRGFLRSSPGPFDAASPDWGRR